MTAQEALEQVMQYATTPLQRAGEVAATHADIYPELEDILEFILALQVELEQ